MGIVKSPLRHAPKNDPAHSSLSEEDHNKVHANTTSDFQTVEEENRFRNFVIKSNPDYARDFKVDATNTTGNLNNKTIKTAYNNLGTLYQDFLKKTDTYNQNEEQVPANTSSADRKRDTPLGVNALGELVYTEYNPNKKHGVEFNNSYFGGGKWVEDTVNLLGADEGDFENEISALEFRARFNELKTVDGKSLHGFSVIAEKGSDKVKIVNTKSGREISFTLNTARSRETELFGIGNKDKDDLLSWSEINERTYQFVNGYGGDDLIGGDGRKVDSDKKLSELSIESPNPLSFLNTMHNGKIVNDIDDYENILFGTYEQEIVPATTLDGTTHQSPQGSMEVLLKKY